MFNQIYTSGWISSCRKKLIMAKFDMLITGSQFIKVAAVEARTDADPKISPIKKYYGVRRLTEKIKFLHDRPYVTNNTCLVISVLSW